MNFVKISEVVMHTPEKSVKTAGRSCIVPEAVRLMRTMPADQFAVYTSRDVNFSKRESNVLL